MSSWGGGTREMSVVEKLKVLLAEKFKLKPERIEVDRYPPPTVKWEMIARPPPHIFGVFITAYENGKIKIDTGPRWTRSEIREYLSRKKYGRMYEKAKTEEEKERILQKEYKEIRKILEDFKQRRFEKYLKMTSAFRFPRLGLGWSLSYCAKVHMWGDEVAKRVSEKHGIEVRFEIDDESGFLTTFDSTGMSDEQLIDEIMKRVDAIAEAREMYLSEEMMNESLKGKGIEVEKPKHRRRPSKSRNHRFQL